MYPRGTGAGGSTARGCGVPRRQTGPLDIEGNDPQEECVDGFDRRGGGSRGLSQEGAALGEVGRAAAIGEQAEVAETDEAVGDDVEEEATEELVDVEVHDLDAVAVGVVPPAEADATVGEGEEPVVGEGDAMGVAAEVGEHVLGTREGRLAVHDPGLLAQLGEPRGYEAAYQGADECTPVHHSIT
jgi:hypothetical protein